MNKLLLGLSGVVAVLAGGSAQAADLPVKARPMAPALVAPTYSWTGCYIGAHAGGIWRHNNDTDITFVDGGSGATAAAAAGVIPLRFRSNASSWLAGGPLGCDSPFAPNWGGGLEAARSGT